MSRNSDGQVTVSDRLTSDGEASSKVAAHPCTSDAGAPRQLEVDCFGNRCGYKAKLEKVFATDDPIGKLKADWDVKEPVRTMLRTGSLEDAELAKEHLERLVQASKRPEKTRLYKTICRWCGPWSWIPGR